MIDPATLKPEHRGAFVRVGQNRTLGRLVRWSPQYLFVVSCSDWSRWLEYSPFTLDPHECVFADDDTTDYEQHFEKLPTRI
jgi:hypothetical protein